MKKMTAILLAFVLMFSLAACGQAEETAEPDGDATGPLIALITDESGLGDEAFNDMCWLGCEKAREELGVQTVCITTENDDYTASLQKAVSMEAALIICAGESCREALGAYAPENPQQPFVMIDGNGLGDNVAGITFNELQGSYLVGVVAASMTKNKVVSFVGGEESETLGKFQHGFLLGVAQTDPSVQVSTGYIGSYNDTEAAAKMAKAHHALGADVIYAVAGAAGKGVIDDGQREGYWVIGVDSDQSRLAPDTVLCSMIKRTDIAVFEQIEGFVGGTFSGADKEYSLADGGLGISDEAQNLPEDILNKITEASDAIVDGEIQLAI